MKFVRTAPFLVACTATMLLTSCPSEKKQGTETPAKSPAAGEAPKVEAPATDITAGEIEKAAEEAAAKIDATNADAELEKLEGELDDGK